MGVTVEVHLTEDYLAGALRADVSSGLAATPKTLPPKWFYDAAGSVLFERITALPEYYPTRAERAILREHSADIARLCQAHTIVELGSGSSEKTRLLIDAMLDAGTLREFVPVDVSETAVRESLAALAVDYPGLAMRGVIGDFTAHLDRVGGTPPRMVAFLGSTIGNLLPDERARFLREVRGLLEAGDCLLLGADLVKDPEVLVAAYDDSRGVTADFNRNVLRVINRELDADFDVEAFEHVAVFDAEREWVEMRLRATTPMRVKLAALGMEIELASGEEIRTEISAKFRPETITREVTAAGFALSELWTDAGERFGVALARAV